MADRALSADESENREISLLDPEALSSLIREQGAGKVMAITVFASWCQPCREEFPMLTELVREFEGEDLFIAGISADEDLSALRRFLNLYKVDFPVYRGDMKLLQSMGVSVIPHMFVFNRKGELAESILGVLPPSQFKMLLRRLLNERDA
jgi:thiol-disulfide isomerase/thioredoxin